jgi:hypothetical protein
MYTYDHLGILLFFIRYTAPVLIAISLFVVLDFSEKSGRGLELRKIYAGILVSSIIMFGISYAYLDSIEYKDFSQLQIPTEKYRRYIESVEGSIDYGSESDNNSGVHHVNPHEVSGYTKSDGTQVDSYHRGGEDGYDRSNPDGNPFNNLN